MGGKEFQYLNRLEGMPWILNGIEHFITEGQVECVALELGGATLGEVIAGNDVGIPRKVAIATRMVEIISMVHERGIVHGDVHWGNWLIDADANPGSLKLIDFDGATEATESEIKKETGRLLHWIWRLFSDGSSESRELVADLVLLAPNPHLQKMAQILTRASRGLSSILTP